MSRWGTELKTDSLKDIVKTHRSPLFQPAQLARSSSFPSNKFMVMKVNWGVRLNLNKRRVPLLSGVFLTQTVLLAYLLLQCAHLPVPTCSTFPLQTVNKNKKLQRHLIFTVYKKLGRSQTHSHTSKHSSCEHSSAWMEMAEQSGFRKYLITGTFK